MSWEDAVREIVQRRSLAKQMGGEERVARQHAAGRYTVRERIDGFLDAGSFREVGGLAAEVEKNEAGEIVSYTPSAYVAGLGKVDGQLVCVGGADFTVRGGSGRGGRQMRGKEGFLDDTATHYRCPLVIFFDSAGADVRGMETSGYMYLPYADWSKVGKLLGTVPVVSVVGGVAGGGPAGRAILAHWVLMVKGTGQMFASGPPVVARSIGEKVTREELGGSHLHCHVSGVADNEAENEDEAFALVRRFLGYLPRNVWELPPFVPTDDPVDRREERLLSIVPKNRNRAYDMRKIVELVFDRDSTFEIKPHFGKSLMTMFARLGGHVVGVVASNPMHLGGGLDADAADKETHFIDMCDTFHVPLIYFADVPGFMVGTAAERRGTLRSGMRAVMAQDQATVPQVTVLVRKAYGMGANAMGNPANVNIRLAWPSGEWSSIPVEGGVDAAYKREIENAPDPAAKRAELESRLLAFRSPFSTAETFALEELIDPRDTRLLLWEIIDAYRKNPGPPPGPKARYGVRP